MIDPTNREDVIRYIRGSSVLNERGRLREELAKREATLHKIAEHCRYYIECEDNSMSGQSRSIVAQIIIGIMEQDA